MVERIYKKLSVKNQMTITHNLISLYVPSKKKKKKKRVYTVRVLPATYFVGFATLKRTQSNNYH